MFTLHGRVLAGTLVLSLVIALPASASSSQQAAVARQTSAPLPWHTDGVVWATAVAGKTLYIGGQFRSIGPDTGSGVPVSVSTGVAARVFPHVDGAVSASVADGAGGWFIGGSFTTVGGLVRPHLAHILADGGVDPRWNPAADGSVEALAVSGTTVYAGGSFERIGGKHRRGIAALGATTGRATAWNPDADSVVRTLAIADTTVYAAGYFERIGGKPRSGIAAVDATTGRATDWNPGADDGVVTLAVSGETVYAGGVFDRIGGARRNKIAALDARSGRATAWAPDADAEVLALAVSRGTVFAAGIFS